MPDYSDIVARERNKRSPVGVNLGGIAKGIAALKGPPTPDDGDSSSKSGSAPTIAQMLQQGYSASGNTNNTTPNQGGVSPYVSNTGQPLTSPQAPLGNSYLNQLPPVQTYKMPGRFMNFLTGGEAGQNAAHLNTEAQIARLNAAANILGGAQTGQFGLQERVLANTGQFQNTVQLGQNAIDLSKLNNEQQLAVLKQAHGYTMDEQDNKALNTISEIQATTKGQVTQDSSKAIISNGGIPRTDDSGELLSSPLEANMNSRAGTVSAGENTIANNIYGAGGTDPNSPMALNRLSGLNLGTAQNTSGIYKSSYEVNPFGVASYGPGGMTEKRFLPADQMGMASMPGSQVRQPADTIIPNPIGSVYNNGLFKLDIKNGNPGSTTPDTSTSISPLTSPQTSPAVGGVGPVDPMFLQAIQKLKQQQSALQPLNMGTNPYGLQPMQY